MRPKIRQLIEEIELLENELEQEAERDPWRNEVEWVILLIKEGRGEIDREKTIQDAKDSSHPYHKLLYGGWPGPPRCMPVNGEAWGHRSDVYRAADLDYVYCAVEQLLEDGYTEEQIKSEEIYREVCKNWIRDEAQLIEMYKDYRPHIEPKEVQPMTQKPYMTAQLQLQPEDQQRILETSLKYHPADKPKPSPAPVENGVIRVRYWGHKAEGSFFLQTADDGQQRVYRDKTYLVSNQTFQNLREHWPTSWWEKVG